MCIHSVKRSWEEKNHLVIVFSWFSSILIKVCKAKGCLKITNYYYYYYLNGPMPQCIVSECYYFFFQLLKSLHCTLILRSSCPMLKPRNAGPKYLVLLANSISTIFSTCRDSDSPPHLKCRSGKGFFNVCQNNDKRSVSKIYVKGVFDFFFLNSKSNFETKKLTVFKYNILLWLWQSQSHWFKV